MPAPLRRLTILLPVLAASTLAVTAPAARPGYAAGTVTLPDGKPVAGAVVRVEGTNDLGGLQSFTTKTDAHGMFQQRLVGGIYRVTAWVPRTYNGVTGYQVSAEPTRGTDDDEFDTHRGGINRSFVWKISGLKPGADPRQGRNYYGGWGQIGLGSPNPQDRATMGPLPEGATVELTFMPAGPLLDGRAGKPVTVRVPKLTRAAIGEVTDWGTATIGAYQDVPTGRYRVTARFITPAGPVPARIAASVMSGAVGGAITRLPAAAEQTVQWQPNVTDLHARSVVSVDLYVLP